MSGFWNGLLHESSLVYERVNAGCVQVSGRFASHRQWMVDDRVASATEETS
jgi:hypothetical protein